jgi:hypothetical protein
MNANRRLEEFILKLSTRQNDHNVSDKTNELKLKSCFNDLKMSEDIPNNKSNNKLACSIDK